MAAPKRHVSSTAQGPPGRPPTHEKNTGGSRKQGRPRKHGTKAGGLKRSSTTPDKAAYEAGLSFTYRYYNLDCDVDVVESLGERRFQLPKLPSHVANATRPTMPLKQWVRQSLYAVGSDTAVAGRSLVASKAAVSRGSREERGFPEQLISWAELWRDKNLRVGESCGGLGPRPVPVPVRTCIMHANKE